MSYRLITRDSSARTDDEVVTIRDGRFAFNTACSRGILNLKVQWAQFFFDEQQMSMQIQLHKAKSENAFKLTLAKSGTRYAISGGLVLHKIGYDDKTKQTCAVEIDAKAKPPSLTFQLAPARFDPRKLASSGAR